MGIFAQDITGIQVDHFQCGINSLLFFILDDGFGKKVEDYVKNSVNLIEQVERGVRVLEDSLYVSPVVRELSLFLQKWFSKGLRTEPWKKSGLIRRSSL
jgi:hypothetical protein